MSHSIHTIEAHLLRAATALPLLASLCCAQGPSSAPVTIGNQAISAHLSSPSHGPQLQIDDLDTRRT
ncbi:MAG: hypothetical protein WBQ03_16350, partial [Candidatus Sulfotelmatobacter sp.]